MQDYNLYYISAAVLSIAAIIRYTYNDTILPSIIYFAISIALYIVATIKKKKDKKKDTK